MKWKEKLTSYVRNVGLNKQKISEQAGITTTYLNQLLNPSETKIPSIEILTKLSTALSLPQQQLKELLSLREESIQNKKKRKSLAQKSKLSLRKEEDLQKTGITRAEAIKAIKVRIFSSEEDSDTFLNSGFKGFNKLSDQELAAFYSGYVLGSGNSTIPIISKKSATRAEVITNLVNKYADGLLKTSSKELEELSESELNTPVYIVSNPSQKPQPVATEEPEEDLDDEEEPEDEEYEEEEEDEIEEEDDLISLKDVGESIKEDNYTTSHLWSDTVHIGSGVAIPTEKNTKLSKDDQVRLYQQELKKLKEHNDAVSVENNKAPIDFTRLVQSDANYRKRYQFT